MKNINVFLSENFPFLEAKFSIYLNRRVFVMIPMYAIYHGRILGMIKTCYLNVWYCLLRQSCPTNKVIYDMHLHGTKHITKTCPYNFDPLKPHFYIVKLGYTGVCIIFRISAQNMDCGYSLEPPRRGGSNKYPKSMF